MSLQPAPKSVTSVQPPRLRLVLREETVLPTPANEMFDTCVELEEDAPAPAPDLGFLRAIVLGCALSVPLWLVMAPLLHTA